MAPKNKEGGGKGKKRKGVIIDGVDTTPMTREQLQAFVIQVKEANEREREERNFFQLERDKLRTFWEITRTELEEARAKLRNKDRQIEEEREKNDEELKFYKQKVKHLQFEHQNEIVECRAEASVKLKNASEDYNVQEKELLDDKRDLKTHNKDQEYINQEQVKALKLEHSQELSEAKADFHERIKATELKYEGQLQTMKSEMETRHKMELFQIEEGKGAQINELIKQHDEAFVYQKNYYNDITLNNLSLIQSVKGQMNILGKQNKIMSKQVTDLAAENQKYREPMKELEKEAMELRRQLQNYNKDKLSLANTSAILRSTKKQFLDLTWQNEALEQRFEKLQGDKDELQKRLVLAIMEIQQKTSLKTELLCRRTESLKEKVNDGKLIIAQMRAENENPGKPINLKFQEVLEEKNLVINDLQLELAQVCRSHDDTLARYKEKLVQYGIPKREIAFVTSKIVRNSQRALARGPAGLITRNS